MVHYSFGNIYVKAKMDLNIFIRTECSVLSDKRVCLDLSHNIIWFSYVIDSNTKKL